MAFNRTLQHFTSSQELATQWASGQSYILDQLVLDNDKLYRCILAHTSGATFAGDSANWTLVNSLDSIAPTTTAGDIIVHNGTDNVRQGIGSDGQVLVVDTAQTNKLKWATIQQGSKNYIANSTFENGVTPPSSWSTVSVTIDATTKIPSGSTSADATITLATSNSSPLAGTYSMLATTAGTTTITTTARGFISSAFTIDAEDKAKVMGFSFYYEPSGSNMNFSGTSANTFAVYIRDVDGGAWIQPAGVYNMTQGSGSGLCSGTFQTTATGTQYQIAVFMINTVTGALSIKFDDFQLGPQKVVYGSPVTDWQNFTPTVSVLTGAVTNASHLGEYRRVGDSVDFRIRTTFSAPSSAFSQLSYNLPFGWTVDQSKLPITLSGLSTNPIGIAYFRDNGAANYFGVVRYTTGTLVEVQATGASGATVSADPVTNLAPFTFSTDDEIIVHFTVPIAGLSSSVQMSNDTDTRVVALRAAVNATNTPGTGFATRSPVLYSTVASDTHGSYNSTTGQYTIPVSGFYRISATATFAHTPISGGFYSLIIQRGGTGSSGTGIAEDLQQEAAASASAIQSSLVVTTTRFFPAGDTINVAAYDTNTTPSINNNQQQCVLSIERLAGPATIAASESVVEIRENLAGTTINVGYTKIPYTSLVKSTHSAWNLVNSRFISPVSGTYQITFLYQHIYNVPGSQRPFELAIRKNGSADITFPYRTSLQTSTDGSYGDRYTACLSATTQLNAGEYIEFYSSSQNGSANLHVQAGANRISIFRIGN